MQKCYIINKIKQFNKRRPSAGAIITSTIAGTMTSLILCVHDVSAASSTLSLTIDSNTTTVDVASLSNTGNFSKSSNTNISASTNNATGYTLSIAASSSTDYDKLTNTSDSTAKLSSIPNSLTEDQFKSVNGTAYNNMWGYLPSKYCSNGTSESCSTNTSFLTAPTTTGDVLDITTSSNATANNYTIALGARVDSSTKLGSYTNTYIVRLVGNAIPYSIVYNDGVITNMPNDVTGTSADTSVNISSSVPVRAGYVFTGWCAGTVTNNNGTDTCSGTTYAAGAPYTLDQTGGSNALSLVAMWKEPTYMQNLSADKCTTTMSTAIDSRDGTEYHIQRLADGNCWLLDNLALDLTNSSVKAAMYNTTDTKTNATYAQLGYLFNGGGSSTDKYSTAAVSSSWSNAYNSPKINMASKDVIPTDATSTAGGYKVGGYYNYCAASAGTYCWTASAAPTDTQNGVRNIDADICPKGWRMPTGNSSGEYQALYNNSNYNNYANYRAALRLPLSGFFGDGWASGKGSHGFFWSSTRNNNTNMYRLYFDTSDVYPSGSSSRYLGNSVRCVLGS